MLSTGDTAILVAAGALAGLVGSAGGITTLVSYPALLAVGVPALRANLTNIVALLACWPGSAATSGPELAGRGRWLARWGLLAAAGGAAGAALVLSTPAGVFARVVPFLVAAGSLVLLLAPRLAGHPGWSPRRRRALLAAGLPGASVYNGYFGAGAGVMVLALVMVTVDERLPRANALKNVLIGAATASSAIACAASGRVRWDAAAPLAAGMLIGSMLGPGVARRVPPAVMRWAIGSLGLCLAVLIWLHAGV